MKERRTFTLPRRMCPRCEGMGTVTDIDLTQLYDESKSLAGGAIKVPGYTADGWATRIFTAAGLDPDKPIRDYTERSSTRLPLQGADEGQGRGHQPDLRGPDPEGPEVDAVQGPRRDAAAHPRLRRARRHLHALPGLRRHAAQRRGARSSKIDGINIADACAMQISDLAEWVRELDEPSVAPAARRPAADPRLVRRDRARLPVARPAGGHAVRAARRSAPR